MPISYLLIWIKNISRDVKFVINNQGGISRSNLFICKETNKSKQKKKDIATEGYCFIENISSRSGKSWCSQSLNKVLGLREVF